MTLVQTGVNPAGNPRPLALALRAV